MNKQHVRVGIGIFIFKDGKFLMLQRHGSHGAGTWALPGGQLEFSESFEDTARREAKEETDLDIKNIRFGGVTNDYFPNELRHYVTIWMLSEWARGRERVIEPDKCAGLAWHTFDDLPSPLFLWDQLLRSEFIDKIKQQLQ